MAQLLLVSNEVANGIPAERSLPVLALLPHDIQGVAADTQALTESARVDLVVLDGRSDLAGARMMARLFHSSGSTVPLLLVLTEKRTGCARRRLGALGRGAGHRRSRRVRGPDPAAGDLVRERRVDLGGRHRDR